MHSVNEFMMVKIGKLLLHLVHEFGNDTKTYSSFGKFLLNIWSTGTQDGTVDLSKIKHRRANGS